jgi:hypothetical protein
VVWLIQIPRLYNVYRDQGIIENFAQVCCGVRQEDRLALLSRTTAVGQINVGLLMAWS